MADEGLNLAELISAAPSGVEEAPIQPGGEPSPTGGEKKPEATGPDGKGGQPSPELGEDGKPKGTAEAKPGEQQAPPATPPKPDATAESMAALAATQERIAAMINAGEKKGGDNKSPAPKFNLKTPPQLVAAMGSEDPNERAVAIDSLVNGIANTVWNNMLEEMGSRFKGIPQMIQRHIDSGTQQKTMMDDYYGKYPTHKDLGPMVAATAQKIAQEKGYKAWTPAFRDEVGAAVDAIIKSFGGGKEPPLKKEPPKKTPFVANGGTRGGAEGAPNPFLDSVGGT